MRGRFKDMYSSQDTIQNQFLCSISGSKEQGEDPSFVRGPMDMETLKTDITRY